MTLRNRSSQPVITAGHHWLPQRPTSRGPPCRQSPSSWWPNEGRHLGLETGSSKRAQCPPSARPAANVDPVGNPAPLARNRHWGLPSRGRGGGRCSTGPTVATPGPRCGSCCGRNRTEPGPRLRATRVAPMSRSLIWPHGRTTIRPMQAATTRPGSIATVRHGKAMPTTRQQCHPADQVPDPAHPAIPSKPKSALPASPSWRACRTITTLAQPRAPQAPALRPSPQASSESGPLNPRRRLAGQPFRARGDAESPAGPAPPRASRTTPPVNPGPVAGPVLPAAGMAQRRRFIRVASCWAGTPGPCAQPSGMPSDGRRSTRSAGSAAGGGRG